MMSYIIINNSVLSLISHLCFKAKGPLQKIVVIYYIIYQTEPDWSLRMKQPILDSQ